MADEATPAPTETEPGALTAEDQAWLGALPPIETTEAQAEPVQPTDAAAAPAAPESTAAPTGTPEAPTTPTVPETPSAPMARRWGGGRFETPEAMEADYATLRQALELVSAIVPNLGRQAPAQAAAPAQPAADLTKIGQVMNEWAARAALGEQPDVTPVLEAIRSTIEAGVADSPALRERLFHELRSADHAERSRQAQRDNFQTAFFTKHPGLKEKPLRLIREIGVEVAEEFQRDPAFQSWTGAHFVERLIDETGKRASQYLGVAPAPARPSPSGASRTAAVASPRVPSGARGEGPGAPVAHGSAEPLDEQQKHIRELFAR